MLLKIIDICNSIFNFRGNARAKINILIYKNIHKFMLNFCIHLIEPCTLVLL